MSNLYDDLLKLQRIPDAYAGWEDYRTRLTGFILEQTEYGAEALIVGAGGSNDFDLNALCRHFSKLTLLDRDGDAMMRGLERQGIGPEKTEQIYTDLLGVPDEDYRELADRMLELIREEVRKPVPDGEKVERILMEQFQKAFLHRCPSPLMQEKHLADYVVCCGVHSQLLTVFLQMLSVYRRYVPIRTEPAERMIRSWIPDAVAALDSALLRWARKGLTVGLEEQRIGMEGGIEGSFQAWQDLQKRGCRVQTETVLEWPFDPAQGKSYRMRILQIVK